MKNNIHFLYLILCLFFFSLSPNWGIRIFDLRCNMLSNPWGTSTLTPNLSWKVANDHNGIQQKAYQIIAASSPQLTNEEQADLWNTGKVMSDECTWIKYKGKPLSSRSVVYWKVRVWDERGTESAWSATGRFSIGLLHPQDWKGKYIGMERQDTTACPMLHKRFFYKGGNLPAFLHINTLGYHEVYINGHPVSNDVLVPAVAEYPRRSLSMSYNITSLLHSGENEVVIWLGKGWYDASCPGVLPKGPFVKAQIDIQEKGKWSTLVSTDASWEARRSGYYSPGAWGKCHFEGEIVKASELAKNLLPETLARLKWEKAWEAPVAEREITPMTCEPNKIQETIKPAKIWRQSETHNGSWIIDMGKSVVGWTRIRFGNLKKGQTITLTYSDIMDAAGNFGPSYKDIYVASGNGDEVFCNKFNYHAYQYMRIQGWGKAPVADDITAYNISTGFEQKSSFVCSDPDINAIHDLIHYTIPCLSASGYMVDCPHLERKGYGGDGNASIVTAQTLYDLYPLYSNWIQAYADAQRSDGGTPHTGPMPSACGGGPYWCTFIATAPWQTYLQYGNKEILERFYPHMQKFASYAESYMKGGLLTLQNRWPNTSYRHWFLGDWALPNEEYQLEEKSIDNVNNCAMSWLYDTLSKIAGILNKPVDSKNYADRRDQLNQLIQEHYYNKEKGIYALGLQTDMAFPLLMGITPETLVEKVHDNMKKLTSERYNDHLFTGLVGISVLTQWLTKYGDAEFMYKMLKQRSYPGYLYMIDNGATTTWEHWEGTRSRIHNCYNGIGSWFYQSLAGIQPDEQQPGYRHFYVKPQPVNGIDYVKATKNTPYGTIKMEWYKMGKTFDIKIDIPTGTTATIEVPFQYTKAEIPLPGIIRYGLVYRENERDKRTDTPSTAYPSNQPITLTAGKYRIIYHLIEKSQL